LNHSSALTAGLLFWRKFDVDAEISRFCTYKTESGYKYFASCDGSDLIARAQKKFVGRELSTYVARWLDLNVKVSLFVSRPDDVKTNCDGVRLRRCNQAPRAT
jgi:hypothetical protein